MTTEDGYFAPFYQCITRQFPGEQRIHFTQTNKELHPPTLCGQVASEVCIIMALLPYCQPCYESRREVDIEWAKRNSGQQK